LDPLSTDVGQHGLERFEVAVNVADQGTLHESGPYVAQASRKCVQRADEEIVTNQYRSVS
jgi:hypothetical protein